ncbi:hypothetical protein H2201_005696 [Coniosporium apollinis]|uniref:BRCT domain-containing protein n=1 Tax=Coniosporium apollinis TaxID=61459 RepID=A0ABQ9NR44_9PEZI|nr:hypothetical protein H2201_005696 [Coniosporium apollinis]
MKNPLAKDIIALTGDFGKTSTHEAIKRWIQHHGGMFTTEIDQDTTHLICTKEHWRRKVVAVKQAVRQKGIKIVTYDWLEDCLHQKTHKRETSYLLETVVKDTRKKKHERKEKERKAAKQDVREFEKGAKAAEAALGSGGSSAESPPASPVSPPGSKTTSWAMDALSQVRKKRKEREGRVKNAGPTIPTAKETIPDEDVPGTDHYPTTREGPLADIGGCVVQTDNHHVYRDATGFDYDITMTRIDWEHDRNERYQLRIRPAFILQSSHILIPILRSASPFHPSNPLTPTPSSSNPTPRPTPTPPPSVIPPPSTPPVSQTLIPINSPYSTAFSAFRHVFRLKTRLHWDERLLSASELHGLGRSPTVVAAAVARDKMKAPKGVGLEHLLVDGQKPFVYRAPTGRRLVGVFPSMWLA